MPTGPASDRETDVLREVIDAWRSATGIDVTAAGWPDRDQAADAHPEGLTVDALLHATDGEVERTWAAEVVTLTWDRRLPAAVRGFAEGLHADLESLALRRGRGISVLFSPPIGHKDKGAAYKAALLKHVEDVLSGTNPDNGPFVNDPNTQVQPSDGPFVAGATRVSLNYGLAATPSTLVQIREALLPAVRGKLDGQLRRAHDLGYPTMLLIDQVGSADLPHGANFLPSPATVMQAVASCVARHGHETGLHVLDFAAVVRGDGCSPVYGYWPSVEP